MSKLEENALRGAATLHIKSVPEFKNEFISLDNDSVQFPDGTVGTYAVITSGTGRGCVAVPVINHRGSDYIGFVTQYRYPILAHSLELPRGGSKGMGSDEAAREMAEEMGLPAGSSEYLGRIRPDTGLLTTDVAVWLMRQPPSSLDISHVEAESGAFTTWIHYGDVLGLMRSDRITCGITLASLALLIASGQLRGDNY
jgi:ADP-ribose pyrophosphatase